MMTSFGDYELRLFRVWTDEVTGIGSSDDMTRLLRDLPDAPALTLAAAGSHCSPLSTPALGSRSKAPIALE